MHKHFIFVAPKNDSLTLFLSRTKCTFLILMFFICFFKQFTSSDFQEGGLTILDENQLLYDPKVSLILKHARFMIRGLDKKWVIIKLRLAWISACMDSEILRFNYHCQLYYKRVILLPLTFNLHSPSLAICITIWRLY